MEDQKILDLLLLHTRTLDLLQRQVDNLTKNQAKLTEIIEKITLQ